MASTSKNRKSYGLREGRVAPLLTDGVGTPPTYGEWQRLYLAQEFSANIVVSEQTLRGDDAIGEVDSNISSVEWSITAATINFSTLKIILGGQVDDILESSGGAKIGEKYTIKGGQSLPYFAIGAKTVKDGTMKAIIHKAKASGGIEFSFIDEEYCTITCSGQAVMREYDEKLFELHGLDETNAQFTAEDLE